MTLQHELDEARASLGYHTNRARRAEADRDRLAQEQTSLVVACDVALKKAAEMQQERDDARAALSANIADSNKRIAAIVAVLRADGAALRCCELSLVNAEYDLARDGHTDTASSCREALEEARATIKAFQDLRLT